MVNGFNPFIVKLLNCFTLGFCIVRFTFFYFYVFVYFVAMLLETRNNYTPQLNNTQKPLANKSISVMAMEKWTHTHTHTVLVRMQKVLFSCTTFRNFSYNGKSCFTAYSLMIYWHTKSLFSQFPNLISTQNNI